MLSPVYGGQNSERPDKNKALLSFRSRVFDSSFVERLTFNAQGE
jgi:hypothetical protein